MVYIVTRIVNFTKIETIEINMPMFWISNANLIAVQEVGRKFRDELIEQYPTMRIRVIIDAMDGKDTRVFDGGVNNVPTIDGKSDYSPPTEFIKSVFR